jgi:hypothetical protein
MIKTKELTMQHSFLEILLSATFQESLHTQTLMYASNLPPGFICKEIGCHVLHINNSFSWHKSRGTCQRIEADQ